MSDKKTGMTIIVKSITRLTLGFILLYGIYIGLNGHISPGGGFAGGVIIALSLIHVMLAFGKDAALEKLKPTAMRILVSIGALVFLYILAVNFGRGCWRETVVPVCQMVIVGLGLFAIFTALVLMSKDDKNSE